jgi:hypothetical protein
MRIKTPCARDDDHIANCHEDDRDKVDQAME